MYFREQSVDSSRSSPAINSRTLRNLWHFCLMDCTRILTVSATNRTSRSRKLTTDQTRLTRDSSFNNVFLLFFQSCFILFYHIFAAIKFYNPVYTGIAKVNVKRVKSAIPSTRVTWQTTDG